MDGLAIYQPQSREFSSFAAKRKLNLISPDPSCQLRSHGLRGGFSCRPIGLITGGLECTISPYANQAEARRESPDQPASFVRLGLGVLGVGVSGRGCTEVLNETTATDLGT